MVGLHKVDSGDILFDQSSFDELDKKEKKDVRQKIGMLFQGGALFDYLTVEENIAFLLVCLPKCLLMKKRKSKFLL